MSPLRWAAVLALPIVLVVLLRGRPHIDEAWENHPAHFWLVLVARRCRVGARLRDQRGGAPPPRRAAAADRARVRRERRLPRAARAGDAGGPDRQERRLRARDAVGPRARRRVRRRLGGRVPPRALAIVAHGRLLLGALVGAARRLGRRLDRRAAGRSTSPLAPEQLDGWQLGLAAVGVVLYAYAAVGYFRSTAAAAAGSRSRSRSAFALLAEAMLVVVWARRTGSSRGGSGTC